MSSQRVRDQKIGVALMLILLVGTFIAAFTIQMLQADRHGYGSGFSNQRHVPGQIARANGLPEGVDAETLAEKTNVTDGSGLWHDGWRLVLSVSLLVGITFFWYALISRTGVF